MHPAINKKIISIFSFILAAGLFFAGSALAGTGLSVEFQSQPLFSDANFMPGNTVTRWVKVTNNTAETKPVATQAINYSGDDLSRSLNIVIREKGGIDLYSKSLLDFYNGGEIYLSNIGPGISKEYEFEISFLKDAGNNWQGKSTSFDIGVGFQGQIQQQTYGSNGGGSGGGGGGGAGDGSEENDGGENYNGGSSEGGENLVTGQVKGAYTEKNNQPKETIKEAPEEGISEEIAEENTEETEPITGLAATVGGAFNGFRNFCWLLLIVIIILILLLLFLVKKDKFKKNKTWWLIPILLAILLIIYYLYCPYAEIILVIVIAASFIAFSRFL